MNDGYYYVRHREIMAWRICHVHSGFAHFLGGSVIELDSEDGRRLEFFEPPIPPTPDG